MPEDKLKRGSAVRSSRMVLLRLSLTPKEAEVLVRLLEYAANEPSDANDAEFVALRDKTKDALAQ